MTGKQWFNCLFTVHSNTSSLHTDCKAIERVANCQKDEGGTWKDWETAIVEFESRPCTKQLDSLLLDSQWQTSFFWQPVKFELWLSAEAEWKWLSEQGTKKINVFIQSDSLSNHFVKPTKNIYIQTPQQW